MSRFLSVNLSKPFMCPVCGESRPWGDTVKHIAYAGDSKHQQWRINHGLPAKIAFGSLTKKQRTDLQLSLVALSAKVAEHLIDELSEEKLRYAVSRFTNNVTEATVNLAREYQRYPRAILEDMLSKRKLSTAGLQIHLAARLAAYEQNQFRGWVK